MSKPKLLGVLLDDPKLPKYGNYPKRYRVLTPKGKVEDIIDAHMYIIEAVK